MRSWKKKAVQEIPFLDDISPRNPFVKVDRTILGKLTLYYIETDFVMDERPEFQYVPSNIPDRCNWNQSLQDVQLFRRFNHIGNGTDPLKDHDVFERDFRALMIKMIEQPGFLNFKIAPTAHDYYGDVDLEKTKYYASEIAKLYAKDPEGLCTKCQLLLFIQEKILRTFTAILRHDVSQGDGKHN